MDISNSRGTLSIEENNNVLRYALYCQNIKIIGLSTAILIREDDTIRRYLPHVKTGTDLSMFVSDFEDELGKGKKFEYYTDFVADDIITTLKGTLLLRIYGSLNHPPVESGNFPYFSAQIILDTENCPGEYALYGYAPLFAESSGTINLSEKSFQDPKSITFYSNGFQSWSHNFLCSYKKKTPQIPAWQSSLKLYRKMHENNDHTLNDHYFSEMHTVISDQATMNSLVISFLTHRDQFTRVLMDRLGENGGISWLCALSQTDSIQINKLNDGLKQSELLMVSLVSAPEAYEVLTYMQVMVGKLANIKLTHRPISGYCSWYYYYEDISEKEMVSNIDFFTENRDIPMDLIQLDDGFQTNIGDWGVEGDKFNDKFPRGLRWLSDQIHQAGFQSGLWIAPFIAIKTSELFKNKEKWMVHNDDGVPAEALKNWKDMNYSLDPSRPEVLDHLQIMASKIREGWAFDYLKIDFLFSATLYESKYFDPSLSRAQVYRSGIESIREGFGHDRTLLGCGAPLGPSIGLFDTMRIGEDTAAVWSKFDGLIRFLSKLALPSLKPALRATIQRSYMHNTLWINDPDCVVVRQNRSKLNMNEILLQLTIFGLSGGSVLVSDDEPKVDRDRMELLKRILPPYSPLPDEEDFILPMGNPLDLFSKELPELYTRNVITVFGKKHLCALINWGRKKSSRGYAIRDLISLGERNSYDSEQKFVVYDYWNEELLFLGTLDTIFQFKDIPHHGCTYLVISPLDENIPTMISSSFHIIPIASEITSYRWNNQVLELSFKALSPRKGNWVFYSKENNVEMIRVQCDSKRFEVGYIHRLQFSHEGQESTKIKFSDTFE